MSGTRTTPPTEVGSESDATPDPGPPLFRIITPGATDEEVAALVTVISALAAAGGPTPEPPPSAWSAHTHKVRTAYHHGPGAWRASGLPR